MFMMRIRLNVPLNLFLNADDPSLLDPSLSFDHGNSNIRVSLKGGAPLRLDKSEEPHFRTISRCQIEIQREDAAEGFPKLLESKDYQELVNSLMPIVNRTLAAVRNFGWVTTAREYKSEDEPQVLLRAWEAKARIRGKWREIAPKLKKHPLDYFGLSDLNENVERGSLSIHQWRDIEQSLVEGLKPNPEQEFLTNALQHLREDNLRLALIEATLCLEIVLSQSVKLYLEVKRRFAKKKVEAVLNNVGLTSRVGLIVDSILTHDERHRAQLDKVLKAINLRNGIVHRTGNLDPSVSIKEVRDAVYATLDLALALGRKREKLRAEPEVDKISRAIGEKFHCPYPQIEVLKYHEISVIFSFPSEAAAYLRPLGASQIAETKIPDQERLQEIVNELEAQLKSRDSRFDAQKHLSVAFERGLVAGRAFANLQKGEWKHAASEPNSKLTPIVATPP
jgi:hypothetical protein